MSGAKTPRASSADDTRRRALAAVHAGRRALRWDEDTYRDAIRSVLLGSVHPLDVDQRQFAEASAANLTLEQLGRLIDVMRMRGFGRAPGDDRPVQPQREFKGQLGMIRELWAECAALGVISRDTSDEALRAFVARKWHVDRLEWLTPEQSSGVIEALKAMRGRALARGGKGR